MQLASFEISAKKKPNDFAFRSQHVPVSRYRSDGTDGSTKGSHNEVTEIPHVISQINLCLMRFYALKLTPFFSLLRRSICSIVNCFVNYDITGFFRQRSVQLLTWAYISQNKIQSRPKKNRGVNWEKFPTKYRDLPIDRWGFKVLG